MAQRWLSLLAVMPIGVFACNADRGLVGIEYSHTEGPGNGAGSGGGVGSAGTGGVPGAGGSSVVSCSNMVAPQGVFVPTGRMTVPRKAHTATLLPNGKVLIAGGYDDSYEFLAPAPDFQDSYYLASAEIYDPDTGTFSATGSMSAPRVLHTATLLPSGKVLILGGGTSTLLTNAELYDPGTGTFTLTGSMSVATCFPTATSLPNGKVLIAGYESSFARHPHAQLYDPGAGRFADTGWMIEARNDHTATLLGDGKVLIAGGYALSPYVDSQGIVSAWPSASAEIYDPSAGSFTATGSMIVTRSQHRAILLPNGMVLIVGNYVGAGDGDLSAELFDPGSGTFAATGNVAVQRLGHTATLLPGGMVLVAGGYDRDGSNYFGWSAIASAELYDPCAGTFAATSSMSLPRSGHTATLLDNGKVLIAGGNSLGTVELYE